MRQSSSPISSGFFIGNILASILLGATTIQTRLYFARFPHDLPALKAMVAILWVAQVVEVGVSSGSIYKQVAGYHLSSSSSSQSNHGWDTQYWRSHLVVVSTIVQSFFAYRLWSLSRHRFYVCFIAAMILTNLAIGLDENITSSLTSSPHSGKIVAITTLSAAIDLGLAFGVIISLRRQRTGFLQMDRIVNRIIIYGIASGMVTSIYAILMLVFSLFEYGQVVVGAGIPFAGVYIASTLAQLHIRASLRSQLVGEHRLPTGKGPWLSSFEMSSPPHDVPAGEKVTHPSSTPCRHEAASDRPSVQAVVDTVEVSESQIPSNTARAPAETGIFVGPETETLAQRHPHLFGHDSTEASTSSPSLDTTCESFSSGLSPAPTSDFPAIRSVCRPPPPSFNPTELFARGAQSSKRTGSMARSAS
ncbi:hypothetical protein DL93DRAFT_2230212 [Clavulina sp. PMI_390]|nr:hypothetical protein DL93DRAFT_2230212 [Clavulina sp. PMI_390]